MYVQNFKNIINIHGRMNWAWRNLSVEFSELTLPGKPSTWFPGEGLVTQAQLFHSLPALALCSCSLFLLFSLALSSCSLLLLSTLALCSCSWLSLFALALYSYFLSLFHAFAVKYVVQTPLNVIETFYVSFEMHFETS